MVLFSMLERHILHTKRLLIGKGGGGGVSKRHQRWSKAGFSSEFCFAVLHFGCNLPSAFGPTLRFSPQGRFLDLGDTSCSPVLLLVFQNRDFKSVFPPFFRHLKMYGELSMDMPWKGRQLYGGPVLAGAGDQDIQAICCRFF